MSDTSNQDIVLLEIRAYVRGVAASLMSERARVVLNRHEKAKTYAQLDGTKSDKAISIQVGVPRRTVTDWVEEFVRNGLAVRTGRVERSLFTLEELSINLASLKKNPRRPRINLHPKEEDRDE